MSYVVHIWEQPSPQTWAQADALLAQLTGRACPPNPLFALLARQLRAAFPAQPGDAGSPWLEGEPDGDVHEAVWALALSVDQLDTVAPRLIDLALALGLTVYDGQSGEVFLPGRWRLTPEGREPLEWPETAAVPQVDFKAAAARRLEAQVRALVLPKFAPHGFQLTWVTGHQPLDELALVRSTPMGQQRMVITVEGWSDAFWADDHIDLWLSCDLKPRLPEEFKAWCGAQHGIWLRSMHLPELAAFYKNPGRRSAFDTSFSCQTVPDLVSFLGLFANWAMQHWLPLLDACQTIRGFLAQPLAEPTASVFLDPSAACLAVAHCAGAPDVAERARRYGLHRAPFVRVAMFQDLLEGLAAFPQYFGCYANALD